MEEQLIGILENGKTQDLRALLEQAEAAAREAGLLGDDAEAA